MKRAWQCVLALLLAWGGSASAAVQRCGGMAPLVTECSLTVVATTAHIDGFLASQTFAGFGEFTITGPNGLIAGSSCYAYPSVMTCTEAMSGFFKPGDAITVSASVTGAGSWAVQVSY